MIPGAFPSSFPQQLADLLRRVSELERKQTSGTGISTLHGTVSSRTMQPGLPAELTSSWNASTGYSAKQLTLEGVGLVNPTVQPTFDYVVTPDGNTSLASGAKGWLEADPQTGGWLFIRSPSTSSSGVYGQPASRPGGVMIWHDDTGQWAGEAHALSYGTTISRNQSIPAIGNNYHLFLQSPETHPPSYGFGTLFTTTHYLGLSVYNILRSGSAIFPGISGASSRELACELSGKSSINGWFNTVYLDADGKCIAMTEKFFLNDQATSGEVRVHTDGGGGSNVIREHNNIKNWMAHYTSTGTAGVSGTLKAGATATEGIVTSLGTLTSAYSVSNVTTDRTYDANATTLDEIADCLGTLIQDLQAKSILG